MLDLVDTSFQDSALVEGIISHWTGSDGQKALAIEMTKSKEAHEGQGRPALTAGAPGFLVQTYVLMWRMSLNIMRNPAVVWLRFAMYFALSILISTVWLDVGNSNESIANIINVVFFIAAFMVFMSISVLPAFLEEKSVFIKERANGAYGVMAFSVAHMIVDLPPLFLQALINGSMCYWCIGLNDDMGRYMFFILDLFLSFAVAEALCFLIAVVVPNFIIGIAAGAFTYGGYMVVQGFFIKVEDIGWWWRWMHWISMHSYAFSAFMYNEFSGREFTCDNPRAWPCEDACNGAKCVTGKSVLELYGYDDTKKWDNMVVLIAMMFLYRLAATAWMYYFHTGKK